MVDGAGGLFSAFRIAMDYGKGNRSAWRDTRVQDELEAQGQGHGGVPDEPPYWHGQAGYPTGVTWDESTGRFSDGSPPTGPGGGPWNGPVIGPPNKSRRWEGGGGSGGGGLSGWGR